jgi:hypothetical protein
VENTGTSVDNPEVFNIKDSKKIKIFIKQQCGKTLLKALKVLQSKMLI